MPLQMYAVTLIYQNGPRHGFTETAYRAAESARAASDLGDLTPWLEPRPPAVVLQAVRAQEVDGLRRMFLRLVWRPGMKGRVDRFPDLAGTAAKVRIDFSGGSRPLEFRGLDDSWVHRSAAGRDLPAPQLGRGLHKLQESYHRLGFRARALTRNPKHVVAWYGLHPDSDQLTLVQVVDPAFVPAIGSYVDFAGSRPLESLTRGRGYLVVASEPGRIAVYHPWGTIRDQLANGQNWVRQLEYTYPVLAEFQFAGFGSHQTGPAYKPMSWAADMPWRMPLSPCGRIVDFARHYYHVGLRVFGYDPSLVEPVKWYTPEIVPGAAAGQPRAIAEIPAVPYEHPFGSRLWELDGDFLPALGEVRERVRYSGRPPALLRGVGLCGSRSAWENGAALADPVRPLNATTGQPCCCGPGALLVGGGAAAGGPMAPVITVRGGAAAGGYRRPKLALALGGGEAHHAHYYLAPGLLFSCSVCGGGAWTKYKVVISGATDDMAAYNGTWPVTHFSGCEWRGAGPAGFATITVQFVTYIDRSVFVGTLDSEWEFAAYELDDCLGDIIADNDGSGTSGASMPATILITGVNDQLAALALGGSDLHTLTRGESITGGLAMGGSEVHYADFLIPAATGGLALAGDDDHVFVPAGELPPEVATGGLALGGSEAHSLAISEAATGGLALGGSEAHSLAISEAAGGGLALGGSEAHSFVAGNNLLSSLSLYLPLTEASGNAVDSLGALNFTQHAAPGSGAGVITNARTFAAASAQYFDHADAAGISSGDRDYTVSVWVKFTSLAANRTLIGQWSSSAGSLGFELAYPTVFSNLAMIISTTGSNSVSAVNSGTIATGTWYHVLGWYDHTAKQVGIRVNNGTKHTQTHTGTAFNSTANVNVGRIVNTNFMDGSLCELGMWSRLLTDAEHTLLYNGGAGLGFSSFH